MQLRELGGRRPGRRDRAGRTATRPPTAVLSTIAKRSAEAAAPAAGRVPQHAVDVVANGVSRPLHCEGVEVGGEVRPGERATVEEHVRLDPGLGRHVDGVGVVSQQLRQDDRRRPGLVGCEQPVAGHSPRPAGSWARTSTLPASIANFPRVVTMSGGVVPRHAVPGPPAAPAAQDQAAVLDPGLVGDVGLELGVGVGTPLHRGPPGRVQLGAVEVVLPDELPVVLGHPASSSRIARNSL